MKDVSSKDVKVFLGKQKYRFSQGYAWIGSLGVGFLVADALQRHWPFKTTPIWILFVIGVLLIWVIGFVVIRFGLYGEEMRFATMQNPTIKTIYDRLKRLEDKK